MARRQDGRGLRLLSREVINRVRDLEAAGVTNLALNVCGTAARELIQEFGREVIAKY